MEIVVLLVTAALCGADLGPVPPVRAPRRIEMTPVDVVGLLLAVGLLVYLVIALLHPERFQ